MSVHRLGISQLGVSLLAVLFGLSGASVTGQSDRLRALFADPPPSTAPRRSGSGTTCSPRSRSVGTLRDLAAQKVKQVFVHPRPGLMTPYLSAEWFRLWKVGAGRGRAARHERVDLRRELLPVGLRRRLRARGDARVARPRAGLRGDEPAPPLGRRHAGRVPRSATAATRTSPRRSKAGEALPEGALPGRLACCARGTGALVRRQVLRRPALPRRDGEVPGDHAGRLQARDRRRSSASACPASSPTSRSCGPAGGLPWTDDLPAAVPEALGLRPARPTCPACASRSATGRRSGTTTSRSCSSCSSSAGRKPYYEYCEKNGLEFTGHYWEHEWPELRRRARQHGDVRLAAAAGHRQPDEPVPARTRTRSSATCAPSRSCRASPTSSGGRARCGRPTAPAAGTCASRT